MLYDLTDNEVDLIVSSLNLSELTYLERSDENHEYFVMQFELSKDIYKKLTGKDWEGML